MTKEEFKDIVLDGVDDYMPDDLQIKQMEKNIETYYEQTAKIDHAFPEYLALLYKCTQDLK